MGAAAHRTIISVAVFGASIAAAGIAGTGVASAHGPHHQQPPSQIPLHAVLNGVMDVKKTKLGRFNFRFHVSRYGVITGSGDYNGGGQNYISLSGVTTFSCSANHVAVTGTGTLLGGPSVPITITATDGGQGVGNPNDKFSISFGNYTRSGSPVAGKVFIKNCP